jgi:hypothetical protein
MKPSRGFVYVATGDGYVAEARRSAASLRRHHAGAKILLMTDRAPVEAAPFDEIVLLPAVERDPGDKIGMVAAPFDEIVFLDTDTFVCGPIDDLFALLETHDLAVLQENNRGWNYELPGVPRSYPEFNTGVIAFRRTPAVQAFFAEWRTAFVTLRAAKGEKSDQPSFRGTLFRSPLRVAVLPSEYHFLANFPNYIMWDARLLHGRGDLPAIARDVNAELGARAYVPHLGVLRGYLGRAAWARTLARVGWRLLHRIVRPPADASRASPGRWWL